MAMSTANFTLTIRHSELPALDADALDDALWAIAVHLASGYGIAVDSPSFPRIYEELRVPMVQAQQHSHWIAGYAIRAASRLLMASGLPFLALGEGDAKQRVLELAAQMRDELILGAFASQAGTAIPSNTELETVAASEGRSVSELFGSHTLECGSPLDGSAVALPPASPQL
jgi:hypothetical protein